MSHTRIFRHRGQAFRVTLEPHRIPAVYWMIFRAPGFEARTIVTEWRPLSSYTDRQLADLFIDAEGWPEE